ncbi:MAG: DUF3520 domain-containing protein, partial [Myxococcales bacterium]|nr:DUF3520 domain-containing protein [Myxococcales bacterium]
DFNDDTKDAGEIGAGHTVTALYEVVPVGAPGVGPGVDPLRYQEGQNLSQQAASGELMHLKLRYKKPQGLISKLVTFPVRDHDRTLAQSSTNFRFSAAVAEFGMLLRGSEHAGESNFQEVYELARGALGPDPGGYRKQFLDLVKQAANLRGATSLAVAR